MTRLLIRYIFLIFVVLPGCINAGQDRDDGKNRSARENTRSASVLDIMAERNATAPDNENRGGAETAALKGKPVYAEKFSIRQAGDVTLLTVFSPWQNAADNVFRYVVGEDSSMVPDSLTGEPFIKTPVTRAVIMSTTFVSFIDTLGGSNTIVGASGPQNIFNQALQQKYRSGELQDIGFDHAMNYETLVALDPDVLFMFGVQAGIRQTVKKLAETGIPVVICADYLEPHPLGRSEWLRFFSVFYGREVLADTVFNGVAKRYHALVEQASRADQKPEVMLGLPWKDAWYVAGGKSYAARLIADAGGRYIFDDENHAEARPFSVEKVFSRGLQADIWINPGIAGTMEEILEHDARFEALRPFQQRMVYNNIKRISPGGGNDYWESGVLRPDLILEDLVRIFHDPVPDDKALHYYSRLR
ncbi:MAG: ABC transporter substrate-binding protein [Bacteroidales bacterium]|nr:ABC transporter substrate-binding protein [Bacteroidales bacterium]